MIEDEIDSAILAVDVLAGFELPSEYWLLHFHGGEKPHRRNEQITSFIKNIVNEIFQAATRSIRPCASSRSHSAFVLRSINDPMLLMQPASEASNVQEEKETQELP